VLLSVLLIGWQSDPAGVGPEQFSRIVKGANADVKDVSFLYEGRLEKIGPGNVSVDDQEHFRRKFQGNYTWRKDGSILVDYYNRGVTLDSGFTHSSIVLFGGKTEMIDRFPDRRSPAAKTSQSQNSWLLIDCNAHIINYLWYYHWLPDPAKLNYIDMGWETIDGHRCLKVQLDGAPGPVNPKRSKYLLWVDVERGAHPLKIEYLMAPPHVLARTHSVQLESFPLPGGRRVWFPISGVRDSFLQGNNYLSEPVFRETSFVVRGSLLFNQQLPDRFFTIKKGDPRTAPGGLLMKKEFDELLANSPPPMRRDPKSVEDRLQKQLAEAERQAEMLEASSPSRRFWSAALLSQIGIFTFGVAVIIWASILIRKSR